MRAFSRNNRLQKFAAVLGGVAAFASLGMIAAPAQAQVLQWNLIGSDTDEPDNIYDINWSTGAALNPRNTGVVNLTGLEYHGGRGLLYGVDYDSNLYSFDGVTGTSTLLGNLGVSGILEGDLKVDPASGELYYFWSNGSNFFVNAIDIDNVALSATAFWPFTGDASGAAFDNSGNLFILDTAADTLWLADKDTGVLYNPIPLSTQLGSMAGFAINPQTGEAWVADGGPTGTDKLYNLNLGTGELTMVGQTRFGGLTSLTFMSAPVLAAAESPEPGTLALLGTGLLGAAGMIRRRRRG